MSVPVVFIVEGYCEFDTFLSISSKIIGKKYFPIQNAKGIGNIIKNTNVLLLKVIKQLSPEKIIITLDYREAQREQIVSNCIELKEIVLNNCKSFLNSQKNGSLKLPSEIIVIIADKTYESWLCADYENLKNNELIIGNSITEQFSNVDIEIPNPCNWLKSKLKKDIDLKSKANRKIIAKTLRPEFAKEKSRSFRKFYDELIKIN